MSTSTTSSHVYVTLSPCHPSADTPILCPSLPWRSSQKLGRVRHPYIHEISLNQSHTHTHSHAAHALTIILRPSEKREFKQRSKCYHRDERRTYRQTSRQTVCSSICRSFCRGRSENAHTRTLEEHTHTHTPNPDPQHTQQKKSAC